MSDLTDLHEDLRSGVRQLCARFPDEYWQQLDKDEAYPTDFVKAMNSALVQGMDKQLDIKTPLMWLNKAETWALADQYSALELVRNKTLTCYNGIIGDGCGDCPACELRKVGLNDYLDDRESIMAELVRKQAENK